MQACFRKELFIPAVLNIWDRWHNLSNLDNWSDQSTNEMRNFSYCESRPANDHRTEKIFILPGRGGPQHCWRGEPHTSPHGRQVGWSSLVLSAGFKSKLYMERHGRWWGQVSFFHHLDIHCLGTARERLPSCWWRLVQTFMLPTKKVGYDN